MKTLGNVKCYLCGNEEQLEYVDFAEWVCEKDKIRIEKFFKKLKARRTRYQSPKTWLGGHGINETTAG